MVFGKKLLSLLLFILVSITAVAATVVLNVSVSTDINNSSIIHGNTLLGTLTFSNNDTANYTINISNIGTTIPTSTISFALNSNSLLIANNSSNSTSYTIIVPQFTSPNNYTYDLTYFADNDSTDTVTETFSVVVPEDKTITSPATTISKVIKRGESYTFSTLLNNTGNVAANWTSITLPTLKLNWDNTINLTTSSSATILSITAGTTDYLNVTYATSNTSGSKTEYGKYTGTITYTDENNVAKTIELHLYVYEDSYDSDLDLVAKFKDTTNDDKKTFPGDIVRIEDIELDNKYSEDLIDIDLDYRVYFVSEGDDIVDETHTTSFDLDKNKDSNKFDIEFQIPYDAEEGDYIIELIATGEVSSDGADDGNEIVGRQYVTFDVDKKSRHMIPKSLIIDSYCPGDTAELRIELVNIGRSDLDDSDDMYIRIKSSGIGYDKWHNYTEDIDVGDTETLIVNIDIPSTATAGTHSVKLYSKHSGNSNSNLDGSEFSTSIIIDSTCAGIASSSSTLLTGQSSEEGSVGSSTKYILTITNSGDNSAEYTPEIVGMSEWGDYYITPQGTITVPAGESTTFSVYLMPGSSAQSVNNAVVNVKSGNEIVASKILTLNTAGASFSTFSDALFGSTFTETGSNQQTLITLLSLFVVFATAAGAAASVLYKQNKSLKAKLKKKRK